MQCHQHSNSAFIPFCSQSLQSLLVSISCFLTFHYCHLTTAGETGSCFGSHHEEEVAVKEGAGAAGTTLEEAQQRGRVALEEAQQHRAADEGSKL